MSRAASSLFSPSVSRWSWDLTTLLERRGTVLRRPAVRSSKHRGVRGRARESMLDVIARVAAQAPNPDVKVVAGDLSQKHPSDLTTKQMLFIFIFFLGRLEHTW